METSHLDNARFIKLSAGVRYWEDATVNGVEDTEGKIPLRNGRNWEPVIELHTGQILNWPEGVTASIHYKVCDDGKYWLLNHDKQAIAKWKGYYVPNDILCIKNSGHGDYIIFKIGGNGKIIDWSAPYLDDEDWLNII